MKPLDRQDVLKRAAGPEDRILLAKVLEKIKSATDGHETAVTDFCDPYQQSILTPVLNQVPEISFLWVGGYAGAERKRLIVCPSYLEPDPDLAELTLLAVRNAGRFGTLTHRDYLGSILALGLKREKIGDIIVDDTGCQVLTDRSVAVYIGANLLKAGRSAVQVEERPLIELEVFEREVKEVFATVSSLRLDAVAAAGFGLSRSKMVGEILADKVRVNWLPVADCSHPVQEGDILSMRGRGRVEVSEVRGRTKKDRIGLVLKRFQ